MDDPEIKPINIILSIATQLCHLRASMLNRLVSPSEVVANCQILERQLDVWPQYYSSATPQHIGMKPYSSYSLAWNLWRCLRILRNGLMLEHLPQIGASVLNITNVNEQQVTCKAFVTNLCSDICTRAEAQLKRTDSPKTSDALPLVWPLTVAATAQLKSSELQLSAIGVLEYLGHAHGINQCLTVVHALRSSKSGSPGNEASTPAFGSLQPQQEPLR